MKASAGRILALVALLIVGGITYGVSYGLSFVEATVKPRYAIEWTSIFIIEHMENSDGQWPGGWEDLRDEFQGRGESHYAWTFEELQTLVEVRWDIQLPRDREVFADEAFRAVSIPDENTFARVLEPDLVQWNRWLRDYAFSGKLPRWLRDDLVRQRD